MSETKRLLCFGLGYTARVLVRRLGPDWIITNTTRGGDGELDGGRLLPSESSIGQ